MSAPQDPSQNVCGICLASAASRGGVPLCCPGCCGKWFHQSCFDDLIKNGHTKCPMCQQEFPNLASAQVAVSAASPMPTPPPPHSIFGRISQSIFGGPPMQQQVQQQRQFRAQGTGQMPSQMRNSFGQQQSPAPLMSAEEDVLTAEQLEANGANARAVSANESKMDVEGGEGEGNSAVPRLTLSTTPEYPHASLSVQPAFYTRISLKYEESAAVASRKVPLDVVCVLDNSGSMSGSKIESLKKAMQFVMDTLDQNDRLAVVNFNSYPTTIHGLLKMAPSNRETAKTQIRALYATGGTDIYSGMKSGYDILAQRRTKNPAACMFLLTDGQDQSNLNEKLELAKKMKAEGTSLFVFGFGTDHDSEHMNAIANAAEGVFTYVESDDMVMDAFGGTIGTQQGLSLSNIQLTLDCAERDVKIVQIMTSFRHAVSTDARRGTVHFVNMFVGEVRDVIVKLSLPLVDSPVEDYELIRGTATFQITGASGTHASPAPAICTVHRLPNNKIPAVNPRDVEVDIQLNRIACTNAINSALAEADKQNFGAARDILQTAKTNLQNSISYQRALTMSGGAAAIAAANGAASGSGALPPTTNALTSSTTSTTATPSAAALQAMGNLSVTLALMQEIDDALTRVQNRSEYERGGRAMMQEAASANAFQRQTYNKVGRVKKFQSAQSDYMQSCASNSKGSY